MCLCDVVVDLMCWYCACGFLPALLCFTALFMCAVRFFVLCCVVVLCVVMCVEVVCVVVLYGVLLCCVLYYVLCVLLLIGAVLH